MALSMPSTLLFSLCMAAYTVVMLVFAGIFVAVDHPGVHCGIAPEGQWPTIYHAFIFSLETLTTIGYGIPNGGDFFDETCVLVAIAVYFEAMIFIILNASIVGVLFARVSVASRRASQIIFSNKATIRCVRNRFYFMFQVGEASFFNYHPVVEAHVRVYGVLHEEAQTRSVVEDGSEDSETERPGGVERAFFQTRVMRLTNPNDELGGMLFMATPQVVSHRIDLWSPMFPPSARKTRTEDLHDGSAYHFPGLVFREADREVAVADESHDNSTAAQVSVGRSSRTPPLWRISSEGKLSCRYSESNRRVSGESVGSYGSVDSANSSAIGGSSPPDPDSGGEESRSSSAGFPRRFPGVRLPDSEMEVTDDDASVDGRPAWTRAKPANPGSGVQPFGAPQRPLLVPDGEDANGGRGASHTPSPLGGSPSTTPMGARPYSPVWSDHRKVKPATGNYASMSQLREMRRLIQQHLINSQLEVVVIVEAIDPHSSNTFQARHSYTSEDITFDQSFEACMSVEEDGMARLDWEKFHQMKDTPFNTSHIIGGSHS